MRLVHLAAAAACLATSLPTSAADATAGASGGADATPLPLTGPEVARICSGLDPCLDELGNVGEFCRLAQSPPQAGAWGAVTVPSRKELESAVCERKIRGPVPGVFGAQGLGIDQSAILWGATEFLVSRAERELRDWAVDRFLDSVCDDGRYAKLAGELIFPNSCPVIRGAHLAGLLAGMATYQAAMRKDLGHLPVLVGRQLVSRGPEQRRDPAFLVLELSHALEHVLGGESPVASLRYAALELGTVNGPADQAIRLDCKTAPAASRLFQAAALLASLPETSGGLALPGDDQAWRFTLLALAVNATDPASSIAAAWPRECPEQALGQRGAAPFDVNMLLAATRIVQSTSDEVARQAEALRKIPASQAAERAQAYGRFVALLVSSAEDLLKMDPDLETRRPELGLALRGVEQLSQQVASANYAAAALTLAGAAAALAPKVVALPPEVLRVVSFGVDVAQARDAESAAAAIDRFAAPPGSYRAKRNGGFYAGLNAYLGLFAGVEKAQQATGGWAGARWASAYGFFAPIGVEVGRGLRGAGSLGVLVHPIDLGVLASWRVSNDNLASRPVVGWDEVFSPGAAIVYGLPKAPLSIAASFALEPKIRTLASNEGSASRRDAFRMGLTLAVDIPVFP